MQPTNQKRTPPPPNLLSGILISVIGITLIILSSSWLFINYQVEQLVIKRTSEYAHSIARIAADSSAEALLSDDQLQLNLLVENVAKDPYIHQATVFSEDGQIVSQHPEDNELLTTPKNEPFELNLLQDDNQVINGNNQSKLKQQKSLEQQFIQRQKNIPFIEKITYQNVTAGWFKLEINRHLLEKDFRANFKKIQLVTASIALSFLILLIILVIRFESGVRQVVSSCQHLLIKNKIKPPSKRAAWLDAVKTLSESQQPLQLDEHLLRQSASHAWINSKRIDQVLICYLEFKIPIQADNQLTWELNHAQTYLEQAIRAFGVQSQGDLINGCLVPFLDKSLAGNRDNLDSLNEAISFIALIQKLFNSLSLDVQLKACLSRASILQLEDEDELVTGISLLPDIKQKITQLLLSVDYDNIVSLAISAHELEKFASITPLAIETLQQSQCFTIHHINNSISHQMTRKFNYIIQS